MYYLRACLLLPIFHKILRQCYHTIQSLSVCLVCLSVCLSVCTIHNTLCAASQNLSLWLKTCMCVFFQYANQCAVYLSVYLSVFRSIYPLSLSSLSLSLSLFRLLYIYVYIYIYIYISAHFRRIFLHYSDRRIQSHAHVSRTFQVCSSLF
jgi:hypothetical protein